MVGAQPAHLELVDFIVSATTPEALIRFKPSATVKERIAGLLERQQDGVLSREESTELEDFLQLEHILVLAKAKARHKLSLAGAR